MTISDEDYYIAAYRRPFAGPLLRLILFFLPVLFIATLFIFRGGAEMLIAEEYAIFHRDAPREVHGRRGRQAEWALWLLGKIIPKHLYGDAICAAAGAFLVVIVVGFYRTLSAILNRRQTVYGDPQGLCLYAGRTPIGPFHWAEMTMIRPVEDAKGRKAVAFRFRRPEASLSRFAKEAAPYEALATGEFDLAVPARLFEVAHDRAAAELETMRRMYS